MRSLERFAVRWAHYTFSTTQSTWVRYALGQRVGRGSGRREVIFQEAQMPDVHVMLLDEGVNLKGQVVLEGKLSKVMVTGRCSLTLSLRVLLVLPAETSHAQ